MSAPTRSSGMFTGDGSSARVSSIPLYDADERDPARASVGQLVRNASEQMSTLVRAEVELAKKEVSEQVKRGVAGSVFFVIAGVFAMMSLLPFIFMWAHLISLWLGTKTWNWAGFLIVFVVMLAMAGVFGFLGLTKVKAIRAPEKTLASAKELHTVIPARATSPN